MKSKMRLGWFIPLHRTIKDYNHVLASVWIRCLEMINPLQALGYDSVINQPWAPMDIAIFLRTQGFWAQQLQQFLQWRKVKTIFLVIVNYYEREGNTAKIDYLVKSNQIKACVAMTKKADAVITASHFLMTRAKKYNPNVVYLPDTVTRKHFHLTKRLSDFDRSPLNLIWSGQSHKADFIDEIYETIQDLPVQITVIAEKPPPLNSPFNFVQWRYETFPQEIVKGDICVSPRLLDNSYDLGHSNFKIMVFLAQGVPVLASPQPSYNEVIKDGYNGFICHTVDDWRKYLQKLLHDRTLLHVMSGNAVESAKPYLTENILESYDRLFLQVAAGEPIT